jgi:hypothetical protein
MKEMQIKITLRFHLIPVKEPPSRTPPPTVLKVFHETEREGIRKCGVYTQLDFTQTQRSMKIFHLQVNG